MDRIGRITVLAALLVVAAPSSSSAQRGAEQASSIPAPRPANEFRFLSAKCPSSQSNRPLSDADVFPAFEDLLRAAARERSVVRTSVAGPLFERLAQSPATSSAPTGRQAPNGEPRGAGNGSLDASAPDALVRSPLADDLPVHFGHAPLEPTDFGFPINLATALRLSDARPLVVAAAEASVWVAEAQLDRAKVLWIPTLVLGADYIRHDGGGPDFNKGVLTSPSVNFLYAGGGLDLSSLTAFINLTDVFFEPLIARQVLTARQWDIQSAKNDALMRTADAYFRVHQYRGLYAASLYCVKRGRALVSQVESLSGELVARVEVERAKNALVDLEQQAVSARQMWRVSSARLTQVLRLNPSAVVVPLEHDHLQLTLVDPTQPLYNLQRIALTNRPELGSRRALVQAAGDRVRREKMRPFLPIILVNGFQASGGMLLQAGLFGLGANSNLNQWAGRDDVSLQLVWQFDAFGIGNLARVKEQRGNQSDSIIELFRTQDSIAAEVTEAYARVQSAAARVEQAKRSLSTGITAFNGNVEGLEHTTRMADVLVLTFRPQEVIYALRLLKVAFDEYFTTVAEYNRAQFELFHALGYPARELAISHSPGDIMPVDTTRPDYLPPVGNGPPPASR
jgi:outer membrane protein TolC